MILTYQNQRHDCKIIPFHLRSPAKAAIKLASPPANTPVPVATQRLLSVAAGGRRHHPRAAIVAPKIKSVGTMYLAYTLYFVYDKLKSVKIRPPVQQLSPGHETNPKYIKIAARNRKIDPTPSRDTMQIASVLTFISYFSIFCSLSALTRG